MMVRRPSPFGELISLRRTMDRMFADPFFRPAPAARTVRRMPLDVIDTPDALVLEAALPGVKPEDVDISVLGDMLTLTAGSDEESVERRGRLPGPRGAPGPRVALGDPAVRPSDGRRQRHVRARHAAAVHPQGAARGATPHPAVGGHGVDRDRDRRAAPQTSGRAAGHGRRRARVREHGRLTVRWNASGRIRSASVGIRAARSMSSAWRRSWCGSIPVPSASTRMRVFVPRAHQHQHPAVLRE